MGESWPPAPDIASADLTVIAPVIVRYAAGQKRFSDVTTGRRTVTAVYSDDKE